MPVDLFRSKFCESSSISRREGFIKLSLLFVYISRGGSLLLYTLLNNKLKRVAFYSMSLLAFSLPNLIVAGKTEGFRIHFMFFLYTAKTPACENFVFKNV